MSRKVLQTSFLLFLLLLVSRSMYATHNRAGEIVIDQIGDLTIRATLITYTNSDPDAADRDSLIIDWGDGNQSTVARMNGNGEFVGNGTQINLYQAEHTYSGRDTYVISMTDPNRNAGILNVNPPQSVNIPFHIESKYTFLSPQFNGYNNSPRLLQPPIDIGCLGELFTHNPNAYDPDGDSLSYELIIPRQSVNSDVPNYYFPSQIGPGPNNTISLDMETGTFEWDSPQVAGEYNIAMIIYEHRNGIVINSTIRDMQILVKDCNNTPPEVDALEELCVIAGENIRIPVVVSDPDLGHFVKLEPFGGPFQLPNNPAELDVDGNYRPQPYEANVLWDTDCNHIRNTYYTMVLRAEDNHPITSLSDLHTIRIKVLAPPPLNPELEEVSDGVRISWDGDYNCSDADDEYFRGFRVWRKEGCAQVQVDSCSPGLQRHGYEVIAYDVANLIGDEYVFLDTEADPNRLYCYRITGHFAKQTPAGNPYNIVESLPSTEVCNSVKKIAPKIRAVSVRETDSDNGAIEIKWQKPAADAVDTIMNPGEYRYVLEESTSGNSDDFTAVPGAIVIAENYGDSLNSVFTILGRNTEEIQYFYRVAFYVNSETEDVFSYSLPASTLYLDLHATDKRNILTWTSSVPWFNYQYKIYRQSEPDTAFLALDSTHALRYEDDGLENGHEYCYFIEARGMYCSANSEDEDIITFSQEICGVPLDSIAPCPPEVSVLNFCNELPPPINPEDYFNRIIWEFDNDVCVESEDLAQVNVFFSADSVEFHEIGTVSAFEQWIEHAPEDGISGCYKVTVEDSLGNESEESNTICVINCPEYELPNTFTPNGDMIHDLLVPRRVQFISKVDFSLYNQWGNMIFHTENPTIEWDGRNSAGKVQDEGVYHYRCVVYDRSLGLEKVFKTLEGYIELVR